jgi:protein TonB
VEGATDFGTNLPPVYPPEARARGIEGVVLLEIHVDRDGRVVAVDILTSSGFSALDEAARTAALSWRFTPARRDGVPVPARLNKPVRFTLTR